MCDPVLIAAILEELGYLDEKKEKDKKGEVQDEGSTKENSESSAEEEAKITHLFMADSRHLLRKIKGYDTAGI